MPASVAVACALRIRWRNNGRQNQKNGGAKARQNTNRNTHEEPPLPSRAGDMGYPRIRDRFRLGGCGLRRSPGSAALRHVAFPPQRSGQWLARNFFRLTVARRRRVCTVFPARSQRWMWRKVIASRHCRNAVILRVNDLAERLATKARPEWKKLQPVAQLCNFPPPLKRRATATGNSLVDCCSPALQSLCENSRMFVGRGFSHDIRPAK